MVRGMDLKSVPIVSEIKHMVVNMDVDPRITAVVSIIVVYIPMVYGMLLGQEWTNWIGV